MAYVYLCVYVCATVTTILLLLGTESIILAAKTHRDYYREEKGITHPEIVVCVSAHASIEKACHLMGIRLIKIPMDPKTFKADVKAM